MSEIAKYEKMLKDNNSAVKKLQERGKQITAVIKLLKSLGGDEQEEEVVIVEHEPLINDEYGNHS